ncbi:MAG: invasin domain 3-containing protein [Candidatus Shapirobacteria bacterium]|nr:invasin domain 3-containing protein [Candidatus Shapirobacteria bacterium]
MKDIKKKIIITGSSFLVVIVFIFYLASFVVPKILTTVSKANATTKVSIKNSFIIGEKIMAKADGVEECVVDVFAIDADGKGVAGKQVQLMGLGDNTGVTDNLGKTTFKLNSSVAKQYELTATVNGAALGKTLTVTFR